MSKIGLFVVGLLLYTTSSLLAQQLERPFIWVTANEREAILAKIEQHAWAEDIFKDFIDQLHPAIADHQLDPEEFLRGLPFNWEQGKPNTVPPFYLTHHTVNGQQRNLDNATDEEWAPAATLIRYLQTGLDCGIAYYLTQEEKYAQCALDILTVFVQGVIQSEVSTWRGRGGWLFPFDGFREVRVIGYRVPLIYDFIAPFIEKGGKPFGLVKKAKIEFPRKEMQSVFRTYADISINYGHTGSNHPILEAPSLVYNALAMDDPKERTRLLSYFLTENTANQDALNTMAGIYKNKGDIWPETSQYLNAAGSILTRLMWIVNRYDPSLHLGKKYVNVLHSLPALDYLVYPNDQLIRWGDGKRTGKPPYSSYEEAYLLAKMDGLEDISKKFGTLLTKAFQEGKYTRSGIQPVLWFADKYEAKMDSFMLPRTDQVPHAGIFLQRNLSASGEPEDGLMCFVGGGPMVHGHASGMDMELYGRGEVLGVDNGRGRYQKEIHENYSRLFAAHNTVIVNGSSRSDSGWVNLGINRVQLEAMEPMPRKAAIAPNYSFSKTSFVDDKGELAEAYQERTLVLIRTSDSTGYYVDIFRSKSQLPDQYHDYLYHNIADSLVFLHQDLDLRPTPNRFMANAKSPWIQNRQYRHPGWHYFRQVQTSKVYEGHVKARFLLKNAQQKSVNMNLFVLGCEGREYTKVLAPSTFEAPDVYQGELTPTLVIRKKGEAWDHPFVIVYEPTDEAATDNNILSVAPLQTNGSNQGLIIKRKEGDRILTQWLITPLENEVYHHEAANLHFAGTLALLTFDEKDQLQEVYMGEGEQLRLGNLSIQSTSKEKVGAFIDFTTRTPTAFCNQPIQVSFDFFIPVQNINEN